MSEEFNPKTAKFINTFQPCDLQVVGVNGKGEPVVVYHDVFKGRTSISVRSLYQVGDAWAPGKGLSLPVDNAVETGAEISKAINRVAMIVTKPAKKKPVAA